MTQDGSCYVLELKPKKPLGITEVKLIVHAIETSKEIQDGFVTRKVFIKPIIMRQTNENFEKDVEEAFFVRNLAPQID